MQNSTARPTRRSMLGIALLTCLAATGFAGTGFAADWPTRPVTMVVPYGPGASNDIFTRALAEILTKKLGQPFVVENQPGAGGFTGAAAVGKAAPDGYTWLEIPNGIVGFKPVMKVDFDPLKSVTPVALFARSPTVLVVPTALPVNNLKEFIEYAKKNPDTTFYGHAGNGTTQHQHSELFNSVTGLKLKGVNYKSSADAQTDLVAGRLQVMITTVASTLGQINGKQLKLIAYSDKNYPPESPKAPLMSESGVKGMEAAQIWWGLFGPAGLPDDLKTKMNAAINDAVKDPAFAALLAKSGATANIGTPAEFAETIKEEAAKVEELMKSTELAK
jgi:tripartite-type tricarboxylate transporter receptor subunit TctC